MSWPDSDNEATDSGSEETPQARLQEVFTEACTAKRAGNYYNMPSDMSAQDQKRIWSKVFTQLKMEANS